MNTKSPSPLCKSLSIQGCYHPADLSDAPCSDMFKRQAKKSLHGEQVCWGIPFHIDRVHLIFENTIQFSLPEIKTRWLCFLHTAEESKITSASLDGMEDIARYGMGFLNRLAATYRVLYSDGSEEKYKIRYRHEINTGNPLWGENCFQAVPQTPPFVYSHDSPIAWGIKQHIHANPDRAPEEETYTNWICAWKNPHPEKTIVGIRLEPNPERQGRRCVVLSALASCETQETPIRWNSRQKVLLRVPNSIEIDKCAEIDGKMSSHIPALETVYRYLSDARKALLDIDMGAVISIVPRFSYSGTDWEKSPFKAVGQEREREFIVEFAAHPQARLSVKGGEVIELSSLQEMKSSNHLRVIHSARQRVLLRVIDKEHQQLVAVRLHVHGECDEYLTPVDRHRIPNGNWFEDYAPELTGGLFMHTSTYINGETTIKLPLGKVYVEVSKGFEYRPVRKIFNITPETQEILIEVQKVLGWREKGWVTADTHVHFLSPQTANLEGAAEGVNVVNLLASQWGEMMSNVGDFDGRNTFSINEGDSDFLVRVGTENRQHILGHISLLGYGGSIITPLSTDGANEGAIGDPLEILLTEWAQKCREKDGLVVIPHAPLPRAEHAATIVSGLVDAMEVSSFSDSINPYQLVSWYRYLNCGYHIPLVGGTDKMQAGMPIGKVRTYSKLNISNPFSYDDWKQSIRNGNSFVTFGPLLEFFVEGKEAGSCIQLNKNGGKVTVVWQAASVIYPMVSIDLIINGEIFESKGVVGETSEGYFEVNIKRSSWICILIRGKRCNSDEEKILAHSSAVMVHLAGSKIFSALDAASILDQIEGSMVYIETIGTKTDAKRYQEMRLVLEQAHKVLHDRLHQLGHNHSHAVGHHQHH